MEEIMENLWACLPTGEDEALTIVHRMIQLLDSGLSSEETDLCLHFIFREEKGIQDFLTAAANGSLKKIASTVLCFLSFLLEWFSPFLENHVVIIKNIAFSFIKRSSSSADEKDKALDLLIGITQHGPWSVDLDSASLISQLLQMASHRVTVSTVLRKVYCLVGAIAEKLPHSIGNKADRLLSAMLYDLEYQITTSAHVQFRIIEGCFEGLSGYLYSFPLDNSHKNIKCERIVRCIEMVVSNHESKRRVAARAALVTFARHGEQFEAYLVSNFRRWDDLLQKWLAVGREERLVAKHALFTFYHVMASYISRHRDSKNTLDYFCQHFKKQLETSSNVDIVVKGFGIFVKPLKQYTPEEVPIIFNILAQRSHEAAGKDHNYLVADYLGSLSVFSAELGVIHNLQLAILEGLSVQLICRYAQEEHPSWKTHMVDAVICTVIRLSRCCGAAFDTYLNTVVHQGIIRTVSHPVVEDAKLLRDAGQENVVTYESYLSFWQSLITLNKSPREMLSEGVSLHETRKISRKLIDKILQALLDIVSRLDLSLHNNISEGPNYHCSVEKCLEATNPKDFTVLANLVSFINDLFNSLPDQSPLLKWMSPLIQINIKLSAKHHLVSSFYKLLANIVQIAQKLGYFDEQKDEMEDLEWRPTVNLLSGFLLDVISRQAQYRDDLQISCLRLMLATPSCIAPPLLKVCVTAFQSVFRIGCSMVSLAHEGLRTLTCWSRDIPEEKMRVLLRAVLPSFDILLQTCNIVADEEDETNLDGIALLKNVLQDKKKKKLWKQKANVHTDTELVQLQKQVVLFLSTLDSSTCLSLLDGTEDRVGVTSWQEDKLLMFPLPFPDMKVDIALDDLLPRLSELALKCGDRQTRSAACEFLHAVIMFMLGKEKQLEIAHRGHLNSLWKHIFPTILSLACDVDLMVNQLFKPLGEELAHWYSSRDQEGSEQTSTFLLALLDGITHRTDAALRDYCASCLHEYTEWSRKQGHMLRKVEPVVKFVLGLCHHPCAQKRMGAALAFNSMYSVLRESENFVNQFWMELLYGFVSGLSMCSVTGEDEETEIQLDKSLQHILKVIKFYSNIFNAENEHRRIPRDFCGGTLYHAVRWLLKHCTALNGTCRHTCMKMVDGLCCVVMDCHSTKDLILQVKAEGSNGLVRIAEGDAGLSTNLSKFAWDVALNWLYSVLASMESYIWLVNIGTPPETLFTMTNSKLLQALNYFLCNVIQSPVEQMSLWRPKEMENFNFAKCCTIVRMLDFLTLVLDKSQATSLDQFWSQEFWQILVYCCVWPSHVGFDSTSRNIEENLPGILEKFLESLVLHAPEAVLKNFKDLLRSHISSATPELLASFPRSIRCDKVMPKDRDLLRGLRIVHSVFKEAQSWSELDDETSIFLVFNNIVEPVLNTDQCMPTELSPLACAHASSMLELHFILCSEIRPLLLLTMNDTKLYQPGLQRNLTHGEHFVACFETALIQRLLKEPKKCVEVLDNLLSGSISFRQLAIITSILKLNSFNTHSRLRLQDFVVCLFSKWTHFVEWSQGDHYKENWLISLLIQIVNLDFDLHSSIRSDSVSEWIISLLVDSSKSLSLKTHLLRCISIVCANSEDRVLKDCLLTLKDQHFPAESSELGAGTEESSNCVSALETLLQSLIVTRSCTILQFVVKMISGDSKNACRHLLPSTLENFMKQTKEACQTKSLAVVYSMFDSDMASLEHKLSILNDFLLPLMQYATEQNQISFAKSVIKTLVERISKHKNNDLNDMKAKQKLLSQIGSWKMLQLIYSISQKSLFEKKGSELVLAAFSGTGIEVKTGKELTATLTRKAIEAFQHHPSFENVPEGTKEMYRQYLCSVFNMLSTMLCNMKTEATDAKFYNTFLFDESSKKIWRFLIDDTKQYMLPYSLTENLKNVKKVVAIRRKLAGDKQCTNEVDIRQTLQLFESQSYAGTLENDITRFDFTHSTLLSASKTQGSAGEISSIVLENDALNNHECMATVCSVIRHLVEAGISPLATAETSPIILPAWMDSVKRSLMDQSNPKNSLVFLLRVILNCEIYFSPYAVHFIQPLLDCIIRVCLQNKISYLLGDLLCLLVKWSSKNSQIMIDRSKVNSLFHYMLKNCADSCRSVFKYHLELIRGVLEIWKEHIEIPYSTLLKLLDNPEKIVGINLTAIMLFYDITPWTTESKKNYFSFLQKSLQDNVKEIFKASAETLGLCLKHLSQKMEGQLCMDDQSFVQALEVDLKNMHLKQKDCDRFLTVLCGIQNNYPLIIDSFVPAILLYLEQTRSDMKAQCLGLLTRRIKVLGDDPFQELKSRGLLKMISDRNLDVQLRALQVLSELASSLPDLHLYEIIHEVSLSSCFVKGQACHLLHDIALIAFDRYCLKEDLLSEMEKKIYDESKALLLLGLVDSNKDVQMKCFSKWTDEERLPSHVSQRLASMFTLLYSPLTEQHFLHYTVPLLLQGTVDTPDYKSVVFQHALDMCEYGERPLISSWRAQHAQMAPMFAQTISSQVSQFSSLPHSIDSSLQLLATQNSMMFQPTVDVVDAGQPMKAQVNLNSNLIQSSFLFSQDGTFSNSQLSSSAKVNYKQGVGFGTERLRYVNQDKFEEIQSPSSKFRVNRFLSKDTASRVFSMANVRRAKRRNELKQERAQRREGQIYLYRKYRKGELPDIQIKYADFIKPLMELAKRDKIIAKNVMVSIFVGVKTALDTAGTLHDFQNQTSAMLNNVLGLSSKYEPSVVGTCLETAYHCQLYLDPDCVFNAAMSSDLLAIGVLLLETYACESQDNGKVWLHLAELYDGLGERDVAHATLMNNVRLGQVSKDALEAHSEEQWLKAKKLYFEALGETDHDNFYESCFECMSVLSEWSDINKLIREEVDKNVDNLWDNTWYEKKLLPRLLHSEILCLIKEGRDSHQFLGDLNRWLRDEKKEHFLKKNFAQLRYFGSQTLSGFIDDWNELNPLFRKRRESTLMNICSIAEVMLLKTFSKVLPVTQDSLMQWETRLNYRVACFNHMPDEMQPEALTSSIQGQLSLIEVALQQGNQCFARKYLTDIKPKVDSSCALTKTRWLLAKCRERHQWAEREVDPAKRLNNLLKIWKQLDQIVVSQDLDENPELSIEAHGAESNLSLSIRNVFTLNPNCLLLIRDRSQEYFDWLCAKLQLQSSNSSAEFVAAMEIIGLTSLLHSKGVAKDRHSESSNFARQTAESYLKIAQYCRKILDRGTSSFSADEVIFHKHFVRATLSAMKLGSIQARQLFPLLLQLPTLSSDLSKDFKQKSANVPAWMFIGWIPQILALLDSPAADTISQILIGVAEKYPNAISYPYNICKENKRDEIFKGKVFENVKDDCLMFFPQLGWTDIHFVFAHMSVLYLRLFDFLPYLTFFNMRQLTLKVGWFAGWQSITGSPCQSYVFFDLPQCCLKGFHRCTFYSYATSCCRLEMCSKNFFGAFEEILKESPVSPSHSCLFGRIFKYFKEKNMNEILNKLKNAIQTRSQPQVKCILEGIKESSKHILEADRKITGHLKLNDFSPWLSGFSSSKLNVNIEIPGQYAGDQKPTPERHVMISRFEDNVQVMPSLRKPIKLTIVGSDASSHNFLVKYGEDLRQDERVQQLLILMNGVFSRNHRCRKSQLSVATYKVIPLSCRLGIIEWVDNTNSLKELVLSSLLPEEINSLKAIAIKHGACIGTKGNHHERFGNAHLKLNQKDASTQYAQLVCMVKSNILRKGLELWSSSAEAFYWLRHSFITSYSTLCIAHWVLGVGDRHLSNCLVSRFSGKCIGIDFGHCFGTATQILPVPELIPFRLTPLIVSAVRPYGTSGLIEETMVNALRALQSDSELLLATMQVFIQDPSVDWLNLAKKHFHESKDKSSWLPAVKINQAHRKLHGVNPLTIMEEDLGGKTLYKEGFLTTVKGNSSLNIRARLPEKALTPRQQVQCLIDLATDPNVLMKTWTGWEPWM